MNGSLSWKNSVRLLLVVGIVALLAQFLAAGNRVVAQDPCAAPTNEIVAENCLAGNPASEWDVSGAGDTTVQGFATDISVNRGGTISFKIDTTATVYDIKIYRLGYYDGDGARLVHTIPGVTGVDQPACTLADIPIGGGSTTNGRLLDCGNWSVSAIWPVPAGATSGVYIARPTRADNGGASHIPFIVRNDASDSDLLFQTSDTTWQSYNVYGGYNAYGSSSATMAEKLSYNRPFTTRGAELENYLFNSEFPMIRWLERNGYDVSYFSAVDTERHADLLDNHDVFLSVGHDEYWSQGRRDAVTAARDAGVHLAFFSGNEVYWKTRWEASAVAGGDYRTQVVYKEGKSAPSDLGEHRNCYNNYDCDPSPIWTGQWREAPGATPENSLSGQISWRLNQESITVPGEYAPLRFWRNTDVAELAPNGEVTLAYGTLGYEWDPEFPEYAAWYPAGRIQLSSTTATSFTGIPEQHHLSLYRAPSGALVFGAGTVQWSWGLDATHDRDASTEDANVQQATVNLLADMGVQPVMLQAGLVPATASTDTVAPTSVIASPANGVDVNGLVIITGTATDTGGVVAAVEVSTDGGTTWQRATGTTSWSYQWQTGATGAHVLKSRAVDDSLNMETPAAGVTVNVTPRACPCSVWNNSVTPPLITDTGAVELGVKFQVSEPGSITAIRFYKGPNNTGTHSGRIWSADGAQLASVTFADETTSGWQQAQFDTPVNVVPGVTYVASYHTPTGYYAYSTNYFSQAVESPPLRLLANGEVGPNGVYRYGLPGYFPTDTYNAANYWVDVVFMPSGPDTTAPQITQVFPADGATGVAVASPVTARFNEPVQNVSGATFTLSGPGGPVPATVTYNAASLTATLAPTVALNYNTTYTASITGGASGIEDLTGNDLAITETWSFTTGAEPVSPEQGPGGPILVVGEPGTFGRYYVEILRNEGLNLFAVDRLSNVNATLLAGYRVVILGEQPVSAAQAQTFADWVNAGGFLIAMRPDADLHALLGIAPAAGSLENGYLKFNAGPIPVNGLVNETIQFHGVADHYTLTGATAAADLYTNATTASAYPAITYREVGSGRAVAFAYDLARSVVYTRQGNPAWEGINGDGSAGPVRSDDMFHNGTDPDWVNLDKVAIPQADEQQRLLANALVSATTLPRFWYFPRGEKAVVILTGDDHSGGGTAGRFAQQVTQSPVGCSVADWECVRSTSYIYPGSIGSADATTYTTQGFEVSIHVDTSCANWTPASLRGDYVAELASFDALYPSIPAPVTHRTHCIAWSDYATQPVVELENGIRLDTNYYYWPPAWVNNRPGMFTGSGMPMRFTTKDGQMIDVYQAATQMTDESGQTFPFTIDALLDRALGADGYYGAFTANMHTDSTTSAGANAIVASAQARGVPVVSAAQMLAWLDGRNGSSFADVAWTSNTLSFDIAAGAGANGLQAMVPANALGGALTGITRNGSAVNYTAQTIKGIPYAIFNAANGAYVVSYATDTTAPTVTATTPANNATDVPTGSAVTITFSEPMDAATITTDTFELRDGADALVAAVVSYDGATHTATLTPSATLSLNTQYTATVKGGASGVKDAAGNALEADFSWTFTTTADNCPCSIWGNTFTPERSAVQDGQPIEVGTKFRSSAAGQITALRFYKGAGDTDTHVGNLWTSTGTLLATVTSTNETASGWQEIVLPTPVSIDANTTYIASIYSSPVGYFSITLAGLVTARDNPPLRALAAGEDGPNGVYKYGGGFPNEGNNANYWIDVVFDYAGLDTTPPVISALAATANGDGTATVTWTTDEPADSLVRYGTAPDALNQTTSAAALVTAHSLALTGVAPNTTYYYRVTSADAAGNAATQPPTGNAPASFTTPGLALIDTTAADFAAGTGTCAVDATIGNGAVRLPRTVDESFSGASLPAGWTSYAWTGGTPTVSGGLLTVNGSEAYTAAQYGPGTTLEFVATFTAQPFQHVGFGGATPPFNASPWIMFSTSNDGAQVYARVLPAGSSAYNTGNDKIPVGDYRGTPHTYRIDWKSDSIDFYVDGALKTTVALAITTQMNVGASDYQIALPSLTVDWLGLTPYLSPCTFTSRPFDAGQLADWQKLVWNGETPAGSGVVFETRTSADSADWSEWAAVGGGAITGPNARYIQYRAVLTSTNANVTPVVADVSLLYALVTNQPPAALADAYNATEDTPLNVAALEGVLTNDSDPDSDPLTATLVSGPANGTLALNADGSFSYTPAANYNGSDSFTYKANDGVLDSNVVAVTITVAAVNDAPVANDDAYGTDEDKPLSINAPGVLGNDSDVDSATLTAAVVTAPANGTLALSANGSFTYTPNANFVGNDSFTYKVNDGTADSAPAVVTIAVGAANDVPVAANDAYNTGEDTPLMIGAPGVLGNDTDADGDSLTAILETGASNGNVTLNADGSFTYTPNANYSGQDSFAYKANDGTTDSSVAIVTVTIAPVNDAPTIANPGDQASAEGDTVSLQIVGADIDSATLTYSATGLPAGLVIDPATGLINGTLAYDAAGTYPVTVTVTDGELTAEAAFIWTVGNTNRPPAAIDDTFAATEDVLVSLPKGGPGSPAANDTDPDGNPLAVTAVGSADGGTVELSGDQIVFTPAANLCGIGAASFAYTVSDGVLTDEGVVALDLACVNDAPALDAIGDRSVVELTKLAFTATASDADSAALVFSLVGAPAGATIDPDSGAFTWTPTEAQGPGTYTFDVVVTDGDLTDAETITITVNEVNVAPTLEPIGNQSVAEGVVKDVNLTAADVDLPAQTLTFSLASDAPAWVSIVDGKLHLAPDFGDISSNVTVCVSDGMADLVCETITVTVTDVNRPPVANDQSVTTPEDEPVGVALTGSDPDGDTLTFAVVSGPAHGELTGVAPDLTYTPDANYSGPDSFTYKANDGTQDGNIATVSITVTAVNDSPVAAGDTYSTDEDKELTVADPGVLDNDTDVDGGSLTAVLVDGPSHGALALSPDGSFTYMPAVNFTGTDSFTYRASDGVLESNLATVTITVGGTNDAPVADDQGITTAEDTAKDITLTGSDLDNDTLTFIVVTGPTHGALSGTAPNLTYTPDANYHGLDNFTFKVNDGAADSNTATVTITVAAVNDAPVADDDAYDADEETLLTVAAPGVLGNDSDIDSATLTAAVATGPTHGTLALKANGSFTYMPDNNFVGQDSFTYRANDGTADSNVATVTIEVGGKNDAPVAANDSYSTNEDEELVVALPGVLSNDSDADGDTLTAAQVTGPAHGTLTLNANGSFTYEPDADYHGSDSFTYKANDGTLDSDVATVTITINPINDAPMAADQAATTDEDTAVAITLSATDSDGDPLTYAIVSGPSHGALSGTAPNLTYTPDAGFVGEDSFTYKANDGVLNSNVAAVTITVEEVSGNVITLDPLADAYTSSASPGSNYGKAATLRVREASADYYSFLKFEAPGLSCATIDSATLRLYTVDASANAGRVYAVKSTWTESGINWNNDPALSGSPLDSGGAATLNQWVEFDVTAGIALGQPFSFGIKGNVADPVYYSSREGAHPPQLVIRYTPITGSPVAAFSATPINGMSPLAVQFTDLSTGCPTAWSWEFGDGGTSVQQNPTYTYTSPGSYTVSLTVSNGSGNDSETKTAYITVQAPPEVGDFYLSPAASFTTGGIKYESADILKYNGAAHTWEMFFDGSDVKTPSNLKAFAIEPDDSLLLSWATNQSISGLGSVKPWDVVRFTPTSLGNTTSGTFAWYFDGSDVGLTTAGEKIDALATLSDGRLLISTTGVATVRGPGGAVIKAQDEDVLVFTPTSLGATTTGTWSLYFDGSIVSGLGVEDVNSLWQDQATGDLYITIVGSFNLGNGVVGDGRDIIRLRPNGSGGYTPELYWDGSAAGFPVNLDGLHIIK